MMIAGSLILALLASAPASGAGSQQAKASDCVWAATPESLRTGLANQFAAGSLSLKIVTPEQAEAVAEACHLPATKDGVELMADSLRGHTVMDFALAGFAAHKVPASRLTDAWERLRPDTRETFSRAFSSDFKAPDAANDDVAAVAQKSGLDGGGGLSVLFFDYVCARAVLQRLG